jgi:hypothetical protein
LDLKGNECKPGDVSASGNMRPQSPDSSGDKKKAAGGAKQGRNGKGGKSKVSVINLRMLVSNRLKEFLKEGKYNGIIRIIADPKF